MAFKIAEIFAEFSVKGASKFGNTVSKLRGGLNRFGGVISSVARAGTRFFGAMGIAVAVVTKLYTRQETAERRLAAVLRSTGNASGFTAEQLKEQAKALQKVTAHGDESILAVQGLLATFTGIKGKQFEQATEMALNLSDAMGGDLRMAAIQLGKALNDPVAGMNAMKRSGVSFSKQEIEMIKGLVEANKLVEAQTEMLRIMDTQGLKGVSRALRNTTGGALKAAMNSLGDFGEQLGGEIAPALTVLAKGLTDDILPQLTEFRSHTDAAASSANALANSASNIVNFWGSVIEILKDASGYLNGIGLGTDNLKKSFKQITGITTLENIAGTTIGDEMFRRSVKRRQRISGAGGGEDKVVAELKEMNRTLKERTR